MKNEERKVKLESLTINHITIVFVLLKNKNFIL
ncbi:hypothetical protein SAMN05444420_101408 [Capnocytophaga granulosa]|uniref:Uncharacterized protein n=1 Tax=Capnocytophaga granulosa TaxID=45242 RepID=A0A1H2RBZ3_9FLAO|nr:hypothetical protein HMPREF9331_00623 [Capnocytophaga granulosa ATCC 51502]SDW16728.1 hypothetical protein SAMN05444420_101408 [Capnocytophaga granulosa]SUX21216.1 Uncharacterised protein [Capnocytophaga granulosa]